MDMEEILPKTCQTCHGTGYIYWGDSEEYDVSPCVDCND
jgi:DnaJ-class molecular chaperone